MWELLVEIDGEVYSYGMFPTERAAAMKLKSLVEWEEIDSNAEAWIE